MQVFKIKDHLLQKAYRTIFWGGYLLVLITAFIPVAGNLNRIKLGRGAFEIRLDHLLHFSAYFLICIYYLVGQRMGFLLFKRNSFLKFILYTLLLATVTEFVQLWVPARAFNIFDWVANVAGVGIGVVVIRVSNYRLKGISEKRKMITEKRL
jgi:VanZ family protein